MPETVRFTETMSGRLAPRPDLPHAAAAAEGAPGLFILTVVTPDVDALVADPHHRSPAFGCALFPALDPRPLAVVSGHLDLFVDAAPHTVEMRYGLALRADDGRDFWLRGIKLVSRRRPWPTVLSDTTTLSVDVFAGGSPVGSPVLRGILVMGPGAVLAQGLSFRGTVRGISRYLAYYLQRIWRIYAGPRAG